MTVVDPGPKPGNWDTQRIAVLGAGTGGKTLAAALVLGGHQVNLWNRSPLALAEIEGSDGITLSGEIRGTAMPALCTRDLALAVRDTEFIFVVTDASAHVQIAVALADHLKPGQTIVLCPGRTGGALLVRRIIKARNRNDHVTVAESQSLPFACRSAGAQVTVLGIKNAVPVAALPNSSTAALTATLNSFLNCFETAQSVLDTSLNNMGAILHPSLAIHHCTSVPAGRSRRFYSDLPDQIVTEIQALDDERLEVVSAYGLARTSVSDWIIRSYPSTIGTTFVERLDANPAYSEITSPNSPESRFLVDDVETGLVPLRALGQAAGIEMPVTSNVIDRASALLNRDLGMRGRNLGMLGLSGCSPARIQELVGG